MPFDSLHDSTLGNEAEILIILLDNYKNQYFSITAPDSIKAINIEREGLSMKEKDLVLILVGNQGFRSAKQEEKTYG